MPKQSSIIKVKGTMDDITFYKTSEDGYLVKRKGGVEGSRIKNDPNFQRTRENMNEFSHAGKAGKLLRNSFQSLLKNSSDTRMVSRLTTAMFSVLQADATSARGQRNVLDGETELLTGFDFNINAKLSTTVFAPYTATIDRAAGSLAVDIPAFVPANMIITPIGATHFKIVYAGAEIDFEKQTYVVSTESSPILPWDNNVTADLNLSNAVTANSTHPLFVVLGIQFYQEVNGQQYPLMNGAFNALCVVKVSGV